MRTGALVCLLCAGLFAGVAAAAPRDGTALAPVSSVQWEALLLSQTAAAAPKPVQAAPALPERPAAKPEAHLLAGSGGDYKGVNGFFNVREANSDVARGQWEFGVGAAWQTFYASRRDHEEMQESIRYGVTGDLHVGMTIFEPLGYGGHGAPELQAGIFSTFWRQGSILPAFAGFANLRIPTGYGSADVDGQYGAVITKTLFPRFRFHLEGWVMNACGGRGDERYYAARAGGRSFGNLDEPRRRRSFQWGVGPGIDYQIADSTLLAVNYLQRSGYSEGEHNVDVMEFGVVQDLWRHERTYSLLKAAIDTGLAGQDEEPHLGLKLQWEFYLK